ncbi:hypothetical protein [Azospirillum doebereinerae]
MPIFIIAGILFLTDKTKADAFNGYQFQGADGYKTIYLPGRLSERLVSCLAYTQGRSGKS